MGYPRAAAIASPSHNPLPSSPTTASPHTTKKKRKKLPKSNLKPGASTRKVLKNRAREQASNPEDDVDDEQAAHPLTSTRRPRASLQIEVPRSLALCALPTSPTKPSHQHPTPSETFHFTSLKHYRLARAPFSTSYSSAASPRLEDTNIKATLRWNQVMTLLTTAPLCCVAQPMKGVSIKIVRPARSGVEGRSMVLHKPHGKNPRCEREVLENFASAMKAAFGWEKDGFVLAAAAAAADDDEQDTSTTTADE